MTARRPLLGFAFEDAAPAGASWGWLVPTLVGFLLRFWGHADQSLWTDEVESLKFLVQPGADPLYVITHNFHGPLHKALLLVWVSFAGLGDSSVRLLSVVIGTLTVPLVYVTARRWLGARAALWSAFLLAVNPFHIWYSQEVRGYVLLMAFGVLGIWALLCEVRDRSIRSALLLYLSSVGACLASFGGFFLLATLGVLAPVAAWRRGYPLRRFALVHILVLASLTPYLLEFGSTVDPASIAPIGELDARVLLRGDHTFSPLAPLHSLFAYSVGLTLGPSIDEMHRSLTFGTFRPHVLAIVATAVVFGAIAIRGGVRAGRRSELRGVLLAWLLVPIAASALLAVANVKVYNVRYPAVGFVPWIFLLALGLESLRRRELGVLAAIGLTALSAWSVHGLRSDSRYARPDARSAAALVLAEGRPGDLILNYTVTEPFRYYYAWLGGGTLEVHPLLAWHFRRGRFDPYLERLGSCDGRLWVVRHRSWYVDPREITKAVLDERFEHIQSWRFTDLPVDLYACVSAGGAAAQPPAAGGSAPSRPTR